MAAPPPILGEGADPHSQRMNALFLAGRSRESVRAALHEYAAARERREPVLAADALRYMGHSYRRAGVRDSAIACFSRAHDLSPGSPEHVIDLADALLDRDRAGDRERVSGLLRPMIAATPAEADGARMALEARLMWLLSLEGKVDSAGLMLDRIYKRFPFDDLYRVRAGRVARDAGQLERAVGLLVPLAVASRGSDEEVLDLLATSAAHFGHTAEVTRNVVARAVGVRDAEFATYVERLGGQAVAVTAADGFRLGGAVFPGDAGARVAAVLVMDMRDTISTYDSLLVTLARSGLATIVIAPRGHPLSADRDCPYPGAWEGRENEVEDRMALDLRAALSVLGQHAHVDTSDYIVVGMRRMATVAVRAAELDPRVKALVLVGADATRMERGVMLGRVESFGRPMFLQVGPEDLADLFYYADALYQAGEKKLSRVSESESFGRSAAQFQHDSKSNWRLALWLESIKPLFE